METVGKENDVYSWELKKDPFGIVITRMKTKSVLYVAKCLSIAHKFCSVQFVFVQIDI